MACCVLLHANTVVAKNVRMSVSIQTHVRCLMVMKAVLLMMMAWNLLTKIMALCMMHGMMKGSLILFRTEQFQILWSVSVSVSVSLSLSI